MAAMSLYFESAEIDCKPSIGNAYLAIIPFESHRILFHRLLIDFQYQSINFYRLISIGVDFDRLTISSIAYVGNKHVQSITQLKNP